MAADVQASLPFVTVELLDLRTCTDVPDNVFATPTYLLNGNVISLGNPARGELFDRLVAARQTVGV